MIQITAHINVRLYSIKNWLLWGLNSTFYAELHCIFYTENCALSDFFSIYLKADRNNAVIIAKISYKTNLKSCNKNWHKVIFIMYRTFFFIKSSSIFVFPSPHLKLCCVENNSFNLETLTSVNLLGREKKDVKTNWLGVTV